MRNQEIAEIVHIHDCARNAGFDDAVEYPVDQRFAADIHERLWLRARLFAHARAESGRKHHRGVDFLSTHVWRASGLGSVGGGGSLSGERSGNSGSSADGVPIPEGGGTFAVYQPLSATSAGCSSVRIR